MQQFQVPQFIDIEDRIIGPLTLKQFLYLLGAAGVGLIGWFFLPVVLLVLLAGPVMLLFVAMAFAKVNGRPFPNALANAINYYLKPRLYLWRSVLKKKRAAAPAPPLEAPSAPGAPSLSSSKLSDLAWSLDVKERIESRG